MMNSKKSYKHIIQQSSSNGGNKNKSLKRNDSYQRTVTEWFEKSDHPIDKKSKKEIKCEHCQQEPNKDILYQGHPENAIEEYIALTDPRLSLFTGEETIINESDVNPQHKLTQFCVYDKNGHLCPLDNGLLEKNIALYFSGYIKPVYDDDPSSKNGVPAKDIGPIHEWFVSGFDGGKIALISCSTDFAEYFLMEPTEQYLPYMNSIKDKIYIGKMIIEFISNERNLSYQDLLDKLSVVILPGSNRNINSELLLEHAQFICDQIISYDSLRDLDEPLLRTCNCLKTFIKLSGATLKRKKISKKNKSLWSTSKCVVDTLSAEKPKTNTKGTNKNIGNEIKWVGLPVMNDNNRTYYKSYVFKDNIELKDYVLIKSKQSQIARIIYMWENESRKKFAHVNWLKKSEETVLKDNGNPRELFLSNDCDNIPLACILSKVDVIHKTDYENSLNTVERKKTFFYEKLYNLDTREFETVTDDFVSEKISHRFCAACMRFAAQQQYYVPKITEFKEKINNEKVIYAKIKYQNEEFKVGDAVLVSTESIKFKHQNPNDELESFRIVYINMIYATTTNRLVPPCDIWINVNKIYRPENTHKGVKVLKHIQTPLVYWSDECCDVPFMNVICKCGLTYSKNYNAAIRTWCSSAPNRFYFIQSYNVDDETFNKPPDRIINFYQKIKPKKKEKT